MNEYHAPTRQVWPGVLALIVCAALWSLSGPFIKLLNAQGSGVSGLAIACYRSLIGGLLFLPLALPRRNALRRVSIGWPVGSVLAFTLMTACFVIATTRTAAANAVILQYTAPLWVFLLSPLLLGERPRRAEGAVLLLAMVGVGIIFLGDRGADTTALVVALTSGLGYGSLTVILRGLRPVPPTVVTCLNCLGSGLLMAGAVGVWGSFHLSREQFWLLTLLSVMQFALPYLLFSWALQRVEAHRAALLTLLETLLNPLWTFLLVREAVPAATLVGGPFILAGVVGWLLLTWRRP